MQFTWSALGILAVAAITPGPNNAIVMARGCNGGFAGAVPTILVTSGSSVVLALTVVALYDSFLTPQARDLLSFLGFVILAAMAMRMWLAAGQHIDDNRNQPTDFLALFLFQFVNPKAWLMMGIVAARLPPDLSGRLLNILAIPVVTSACLAVWALGGVSLRRMLSSTRARTGFDRTMAALLGVFAILFAI